MDHKDCDHSNCAHSTNRSVCQTLSEMDWERGMWNAAFNGDNERVQSIIDKARNVKEAVNAPDNSGYTALHYAARSGHVDICKLLFKNQAHVNASTSGKATPLHKAAAAAHIHPYGETRAYPKLQWLGLIQPAWLNAGKIATVKFLINSGADIKAQDIDGETALHKAAGNKNVQVVNFLLEMCPELASIKDAKGQVANINPRDK